MMHFGGAFRGILILVGLSCSLSAQRYQFKYYGEEEGLRNLAPLCVLQDRAGFLWVGTQNGLFRYEGRNFASYGRAEGLPSLLIYSIHETSDGVLWVGTAGGLARRNGERFETVYPGLGGSVIWLSAMASDAQGRLFVATLQGLLVGEPDKSQAAGMRFRMVDQFPDEKAVRGVSVDSSGAAWFGWKRQIGQYAAGRLVLWGEDRGVPQDRWDAAKADPAGNVWIRSQTRLRVLRKGASQFTSFDDGLAGNKDFAQLFLDRGGQLWVPTEKGLAHRVGERWLIVGAAEGLEISANMSLHQDREGSIWIGVPGAGLARWLGYGEWESWTPAEGLSDPVIWAIVREPGGRVWVGTERGLNQMPASGSRWSAWKGDPVLAASRVLALARGREGDLWIGAAPGGLLRLDPRTGRAQSFGPAQGLSKGRVASLLADSSGRVWVATTEGLFRSGAGGRALQFENVNPFGAPAEAVQKVIEDRRGRFWVAGRRGLAVLEADRWRNFSVKDGLASNAVARLAAAADDSLWIGYRESLGVSRLTLAGGKLNVSHYTARNGLRSDKVVFVGLDGRGWVWVGTDNGADVHDGRLWRHFGRADGLIWSDCSSDAFLAAQDGSVWLGTSRGLSRFQPDAALRAMAGAAGTPVAITEVQFIRDDRRTQSRITVRGADAPPQLVRYAQATLEVKFAALAFRDEAEIRFRRRLVGLEREWIETGQREAQYPQLPPGRYTFEVLARGPNGAWSAAPASFSFEVLPPWWGTGWFRILAALAVLSLLYLVSRRQRMREVRRDLEAAVEKRTAELRHAQEALRRSTDVLDTTIRTAPVAILVLDAGNNVKLWNQATERDFGWREQEVLGGPVPFVPEPQWPAFCEMAARLLRDEALSVPQLTYSRQDGARIEVRLFAAPLHGAEGAVTGSVWVIEDITEKKHLEAQLLQAQKLESVGKLAGGVAHDFNNLLTVIIGYCGLLQRALPAERGVSGYADEILKASTQASGLTRQLLAFSRQQILEPKVLDLNTLITDFQKMLRRLIGEHIELATELQPKLGHVKVDPGQIQQVIMNLAVNARDAMPGGGRLTIQTSRTEVNEGDASRRSELSSGQYAVLTVRDTGMGIDDETLPRVFEPFFTTKERGKGTGLGLSTVYGIVKQSAGHIEVQSELGRGTTFTIYLPLVDEVAPSPAGDERQSAIPQGSETVLVVEDQPEVRRLVCDALRGFGYVVLDAADAAEALRISEGHAGPLHLLVTDVVMPGLNGRELAGRLRPVRPDMRVLFMTGYTDDLAFRSADPLDRDGFLQKPFTPETLGRKVRGVLDLPRPAIGGPILPSR